MPLFEPPLIERDLGNYATAKKRMQKAIDIDEKKYEPGYPSLGIDYTIMALIERDLGNYATAKKWMQKAIDIDEKKYEPGHPVLAIYYSHRGLIELNLGNYEVAKDLTQKAVNIYKQKFEHGHPRLGIFYRNLATIHLAIGKGNNEIACGLFKKAYQILYDANGKNHPKTKKCKEYLQEHCPGFFDQNE